MRAEGNRSSGTSRNYRANAAFLAASVLIHLHALLPQTNDCTELAPSAPARARLVMSAPSLPAVGWVAG